MYSLYIANKNYSSWSLRPWLLMRELDIPFEERLQVFAPARTVSRSGASRRRYRALPGRRGAGGLGFAGDHRVLAERHAACGRPTPRRRVGALRGRGDALRFGALRGICG